MPRVTVEHFGLSTAEWLDYAKAKRDWQERILVRSPSVGGMPATGGSASCAAKWCSSHCLYSRPGISLEELATAGITNFVLARFTQAGGSALLVASRRAVC